jgi:hypothetical protein
MIGMWRERGRCLMSETTSKPSMPGMATSITISA